MCTFTCERRFIIRRSRAADIYLSNNNNDDNIIINDSCLSVFYSNSCAKGTDTSRKRWEKNNNKTPCTNTIIYTSCRWRDAVHKNIVYY